MSSPFKGETQKWHFASHSQPIDWKVVTWPHLPAREAENPCPELGIPIKILFQWNIFFLESPCARVQLEVSCKQHQERQL